MLAWAGLAQFSGKLVYIVEGLEGCDFWAAWLRNLSCSSIGAFWSSWVCGLTAVVAGRGPRRAGKSSGSEVGAFIALLSPFQANAKPWGERALLVRARPAAGTIRRRRRPRR
jgi:hypothetical protein